MNNIINLLDTFHAYILKLNHFIWKHLIKNIIVWYVIFIFAYSKNKKKYIFEQRLINIFTTYKTYILNNKSRKKYRKPRFLPHGKFISVLSIGSSLNLDCGKKVSLLFVP